MRYLNRIGAFILAIVFVVGLAVVNSSAQVRVIYRRPIVTSHIFAGDPFWYGRYGYNPYFYDPYYYEQQRRYSDQRAVSHYSKEMSKDRQKGDMEKLAKDTRKYNEAIDRLNRDS